MGGISISTESRLKEEKEMIRFASTTTEFGSDTWEEVKRALAKAGVVPLVRATRPLDYEMSAYLVKEKDANKFKEVSDQFNAGYEITESKIEEVRKADDLAKKLVSKLDDAGYDPGTDWERSIASKIRKMSNDKDIKKLLDHFTATGFKKLFPGYELLKIPESKKGKDKMNILEAKDLDVYKRLLKVLGEYSEKFPGTGVGKMFDQALANGKKILPKDKLAIEILYFILKNNTMGAAVHKILNTRFSCLPVDLRPLVKDGRSKEVAHWAREALVSDKVKDLIDWDGSGKAGSWSNVDGEKVKLYDLSQEKKD